MKIQRAILILLLVTSGFAIPSVTAQETAERPKIGLTLSGGGAKGFAHLGVLKVLEEYRVPIDYITGTSMGSIMAGLYASGMTPEEIQVKMGDVDWISLFRDQPPREELDYRRKEEETRYSWNVEFGVKKSGIALRGGVLAGQKIGLLLRENTLHASAIDDFGDLPIPFKAIAADLETGQSYVLERGDLARAMRASMSIPVFFTPIEIDGRLLVDGGITENMPVDLTRSMGSDVVIGVDVSEPLRSREEITNVFSV
ncbi:MAG: patatin-like phospholipase family protein, partial [Gemmatimonadetes bacterium]|nr:patatin-like phospholipase family protein [Gemmatimonadota bacterium]